MSYRILVLDGITERGMQLLKAEGWTIDSRKSMPAPELAAMVAPYHAMMIRSASQVTAEVLDAADARFLQVYADPLTHAPAALLERVEADGVTVLQLVPAHLRALLDEIDDAPAPALTGLRWLLLSGEALPPDLCRRWLSRYPAVPMVNAYGPTECCDNVTQGLVREPPPATSSRVPIGRPIANSRLYVLESTPGPVRWKLCTFEWSRTKIV